jgi:hypothetical protein
LVFFGGAAHCADTMTTRNSATSSAIALVTTNFGSVAANDFLVNWQMAVCEKRVPKSTCYHGRMDASSASQRDAGHQLRCAQQIVAILFEKTGLSVFCSQPAVMVCGGNWISFTMTCAVSPDVVFHLTGSSGRLSFVRDVFGWFRAARSKGSPSLHITNLGAGKPLHGHVDAHYWAVHPLGHAREYFTKRTRAPSEILKSMQSRNGQAAHG